MSCWMSRVALGLFVGSVAASVAGAAQPNTLVIATFDDRALNQMGKNTAGGAFASWCPSMKESCGHDFVADDALGTPGGQAIKLNYSVMPPPHFNGWLQKLKVISALAIAQKLLRRRHQPWSAGSRRHAALRTLGTTRSLPSFCL